MAATQYLNSRAGAPTFFHLISRLLAGAALSTVLTTAAVRAEQLTLDIEPIVSQSTEIGVPATPVDFEVSPEPASHPLAPLSAAGVVAAASLQSATLIATGPVGVATAFRTPQASPSNLLRPRPPEARKTDAPGGQVQLLAATIFAEARSEGVRGMRAVAHVIQNRVGSRFGRTMSEVILKPWQFSAWNRGDPNRKIALDPDRHARRANEGESWVAAQTIAREVLEGRSVDPTGGALFYHTLAVKPRWSSSGVGKRVIGQHIFYRDVRG